MYWLYACCSRRQRLLAMIWWTRQVRVTWAAFRKESAVPVVATPASTRAPVHPIASRRAPRDFSAAISIWSPPKRMAKWSSPCVLGHLHWICLASVYCGWSTVMIGIWPGFTISTAVLITQTVPSCSSLVVLRLIRSASLNTGDTRAFMRTSSMQDTSSPRAMHWLISSSSFTIVFVALTLLNRETRYFTRYWASGAIRSPALSLARNRLSCNLWTLLLTCLSRSKVEALRR